jgi:lipopolysaccharide export system permease protein
VNIRNVLPNLTLLGVRIYEFDDTLRLKTVRTAESGTFAGEGRWQLTGVRTTELSPAAIRVVDDDAWTWETVLRPSLLTVYQVAPERLELNVLWENMHLLSGGALKTTRFEIAFWNKIFFPVAVIVMMIVALPFSYFQRRRGGIGFRVFAGTILGLSFFLVGRLFSNLGVLNDWPPLFSATFPLVTFVALTGALLWWLERR